MLDARGWASRSPAEVRGFLETLPLVEGIAETVDWCRRRRLVPILAATCYRFSIVGWRTCRSQRPLAAHVNLGQLPLALR
ncbi:hypothetical protein Ais01nite_02800 [Asanoa ishikariensis]|nr:hypothetical protein Ais01nite_02800 [Asanoa ishikariensis]